MKRILSLVVAIVMVYSMGTTTFALSPELFGEVGDIICFEEHDHFAAGEIPDHAKIISEFAQCSCGGYSYLENAGSYREKCYAGAGNGTHTVYRMYETCRSCYRRINNISYTSCGNPYC